MTKKTSTKEKKITSIDYEEWLIDSLRKNPKKAELYLQTALEEYQKDGCNKALLMAMRHVAEAHGGIACMAKKTGLNRESLYKTLSARGNPKLQTFGILLNALGFRLSIHAA